MYDGHQYVKSLRLHAQNEIFGDTASLYTPGGIIVLGQAMRQKVLRVAANQPSGLNLPPD